MKFRRRIVSIALAALLVCAMALPASARTVSLGREWSGFTYATSDTCNTRSFSCIIEAGSRDYDLCTNVTTYTGLDAQETFHGSPTYMISSTASSLSYAITKIVCYHILSGTNASMEHVWAG